MICKSCGSEFVQPRKDAVYCGKKCRDKAYKHRKKASSAPKIKGIDLTGNVFGRLKVAKRTDERRNTFVVYLCECECGNETKATTGALRSGGKRSCGCLEVENRLNLMDAFSERAVKHGGWKTAAYKSWVGMKSRCSDLNNKDYGGRGIRVCEAWSDSFDAFLSDMGNPPPGGTIDRIDNSKGYSKENCRWATNKEQCRNRTNNAFVMHEGRIITVAEYAEELNMSWSGADKKAKRSGIYIGRVVPADAMLDERAK